MKEKLLIIGAGGHGRVAADVAEAMGKYSEIAFVDDGVVEKMPRFPLLGGSAVAEEKKDEYEVFVAIGNSRVRQQIMEKLDAEFATLIHPSAIIGSNVTIGAGTIIMPGAIINTETTIGKGVILNTASSVDHECEIGDYCHIAVGAHLCGAVHVGEHTWIGAGATVIQCVNVCEKCMIGAGAVVVENIMESGTYVGVPAKRK